MRVDTLTLRPVTMRGLGEEGLVPDRLDNDEHDVEQDGDGGEQQRLHRRLARVGLGLGVVGNDQREHRQRGDDHEEGAGAGEIVFLLPIAQRAHEQRRADHAVQHDHQRRKHGVAGERRVVLPVQHDRGEQRHLDDDHREGEHERAVRLAEPLGDRLGVTHHAEGAPHHGAEQPEKEKNRERIVVEVGEERLLEQIGENDACHPRDRRPLGGEQCAPILLLGGCRLEGLALVHQGSRLPGPLEHDPEKWKPVFRQDHAQTRPSHHASGPLMRRN